MRECRRTELVRAAVSAEKPIRGELADHASVCRDCTAALAEGRLFDSRLRAGIHELISDGLPPDTLDAARLGAPARRRYAFPRLAISGVSAAVLLALATIGVAATAAGVASTLREQGGPTPDLEAVQRDFTACYVREVVALDPEREGGSFAVTVERCFADLTRHLDPVAYGVVAVFNREATAATECLRQRGWDVEPVLEPGGRFLVSPASAPAGGDQARYQRDVEACSDE